MSDDVRVPLEVTRSIGALRQRIDAMEALVVRVAAMLGSVGVLLGAFLPLSVSDEGTDSLAEVLTFFGEPDDAERTVRGAEWLLLLGVCGLLVMLLGCVWLFAKAWGRRGTERTARVGGAIAVLAAVGTGVVVIMWVASATRSDMSGGPAVWFLLGGVVLALLLTRSDAGRRLWVGREGPGLRR